MRKLLHADAARADFRPQVMEARTGLGQFTCPCNPAEESSQQNRDCRQGNYFFHDEFSFQVVAEVG